MQDHAHASAAIAPTCFVIFGVTGDLAQRKLFPALFNLFADGALPEHFKIVGYSRRPLSPEEFRTLMTNSIAPKNPDPALLEQFLARSVYQQGNFDEKESYDRLAQALAAIDEADFGRCSNKLFYLSVPPNLYEGIFDMLAASGLTIPCGGDLGWTRVLVEKPFGRDSRTAKHLDAKLGDLFQESQIFRIDHYLAKETLQNILAFRFSNAMFEPLWSNHYIESVDIRLHEKLDLQGRGAFYDDVGAIRDVGQNHILVMLALIAMENPEELTSDAIRKKRAMVYKKLVPIDETNMSQFVTRGQYRGLREEKGVRPDSETETYFKITATIDDLRWQGVPFHLESGKALRESKAEISINFKKTPCLCPNRNEAGHEHQNRLVFRIQPDEGISLQFYAKKPGLDFEVESQVLSFSYKAAVAQRIPDAYEKVLYDCVRGDQTLFASTEEVKASWRYMTPIIESLSKLPLKIYEKGSSAENVI